MGPLVFDYSRKWSNVWRHGQATCDADLCADRRRRQSDGRRGVAAYFVAGGGAHAGGARIRAAGAAAQPHHAAAVADRRGAQLPGRLPAHPGQYRRSRSRPDREPCRAQRPAHADRLGPVRPDVRGAGSDALRAALSARALPHGIHRPRSKPARGRPGRGRAHRPAGRLHAGGAIRRPHPPRGGRHAGLSAQARRAAPSGPAGQRQLCALHRQPCALVVVPRWRTRVPCAGVGQPGIQPDRARRGRLCGGCRLRSFPVVPGRAAGGRAQAAHRAGRLRAAGVAAVADLSPRTAAAGAYPRLHRLDARRAEPAVQLNFHHPALEFRMFRLMDRAKHEARGSHHRAPHRIRAEHLQGQPTKPLDALPCAPVFSNSNPNSNTEI
ncbi:protein of unknown function [Cupriavidus taiwanensis]|nr:protein of unknown function [Cupriavidus taiwanensis]